MKKTTTLLIAVAALVLIFAIASQQVQAQASAQKMIGQETADELIKKAETNPYKLKLSPNIPEDITAQLTNCNIQAAGKAFQERKNTAGINQQESLFWDFLFCLKASEIVHNSGCLQKQMQNSGMPEALSLTIESTDTVSNQDTAATDSIVASDSGNAITEDDSTSLTQAPSIYDTITINNAYEYVRFTTNKIINTFVIKDEAQLRFMLEIVQFEILESKLLMDLAIKLSSKSENTGFWCAVIANFYNDREDFIKACENKAKAVKAGYNGSEIDLGRITKCN